MKPALTEHPPGVFRDRDEDTAHALRFITDRAVAEREVAFLDEAMAVHGQQLILEIRGFAAGHHALEHGANEIPDLGKAFTRALAEGGRMVEAR